jgi:hypothetical protein
MLRRVEFLFPEVDLSCKTAVSACKTPSVSGDWFTIHEALVKHHPLVIK